MPEEKSKDTLTTEEAYYKAVELYYSQFLANADAGRVEHSESLPIEMKPLLKGPQKPQPTTQVESQSFDPSIMEQEDEDYALQFIDSNATSVESKSPIEKQFDELKTAIENDKIVLATVLLGPAIEHSRKQHNDQIVTNNTAWLENSAKTRLYQAAYQFVSQYILKRREMLVNAFKYTAKNDVLLKLNDQHLIAIIRNYYNNERNNKDLRQFEAAFKIHALITGQKAPLLIFLEETSTPCKILLAKKNNDNKTLKNIFIEIAMSKRNAELEQQMKASNKQHPSLEDYVQETYIQPVLDNLTIGEINSVVKPIREEVVAESKKLSENKPSKYDAEFILETANQLLLWDKRGKASLKDLLLDPGIKKLIVLLIREGYFRTKNIFSITCNNFINALSKQLDEQAKHLIGEAQSNIIATRSADIDQKPMEDTSSPASIPVELSLTVRNDVENLRRALKDAIEAMIRRMGVILLDETITPDLTYALYDPKKNQKESEEDYEKNNKAYDELVKQFETASIKITRDFREKAKKSRIPDEKIDQTIGSQIGEFDISIVFPEQVLALEKCLLGKLGLLQNAAFRNAIIEHNLMTNTLRKKFLEKNPTLRLSVEKASLSAITYTSPLAEAERNEQLKKYQYQIEEATQTIPVRYYFNWAYYNLYSLFTHETDAERRQREANEMTLLLENHVEISTTYHNNPDMAERLLLEAKQGIIATPLLLENNPARKTPAASMVVGGLRQPSEMGMTTFVTKDSIQRNQSKQPLLSEQEQIRYY